MTPERLDPAPEQDQVAESSPTPPQIIEPGFLSTYKLGALANAPLALGRTLGEPILNETITESAPDSQQSAPTPEAQPPSAQ